MTYERAIETQRLRLLRLVAGLLAAVAFLSVGPLCPAVSRWVGGIALSILSRAEAAAQCLVIAQARLIAARTGCAIDPKRLLDHRYRDSTEFETAGSLSTLRARLTALRALLEDLPRFGLRLLRQTEKRVRRLDHAQRTHRTVLWRDTSEALCALPITSVRIERPPDKGPLHISI